MASAGTIGLASLDVELTYALEDTILGQKICKQVGDPVVVAHTKAALFQYAANA